MSGKSAILSVKIIGDAKGAVKAFKDTEDATDGLGGKLGKFGPAVAGVAAAAGAAALAAGKYLYNVGAVFDDLTDTIRVGTGATGQALDGLVENAKNVGTQVPASFEQIGPVVADLNTRMGLSGKTMETVASQYLEATRILGEEVSIEATSAAFNAFGIEGENVSAALDNLFQVSQATGVGMNDLAGDVQKHSPVLREMGFTFADSAALIGGFNKAGLESDKILAGMGKSMVTMATPGETAQDTFKRLSGQIEGYLSVGDRAAALDLAGQVFGTKGAPQMIAAIESGQLAFSDLMGQAGATGDTILGVGRETMDAAEKWEIFKNKALVILEPLGSAIFDKVGAALDYVMGLVEGFDMGAFVEANPWVETLAANVQSFATALGDFLLPIIQTVAPYVMEAVTIIGTYLGDLFAVFSEVFGFLGAILQGDWSTAWEHAQGIVEAGKTLIVNYVSGMKDFLVNIFSNIASGIGERWSSAWNYVKTAASEGITAAVDYVKALPGRAATAIIDGGSKLYDAGRDMIQGMINGISDMAGRTYDQAVSVVKGAVDGVKSFLGIQSPSRLFKEIGAFTGEGLAIGISSKKNMVTSAFNDLVTPPKAPTYDLGINLRPYDQHATAAEAASTVINITVNGALDSEATARQIVELIQRHERRYGPRRIEVRA